MRLMIFLLSLTMISCGRTPQGSAPTMNGTALYDAHQTFEPLVGLSRSEIASGIGSNYKIISKLSGIKMEYLFYVDTTIRAVCLESPKLVCSGEYVTVWLLLDQNEVVTSVQVNP